MTDQYKTALSLQRSRQRHTNRVCLYKARQTPREQVANALLRRKAIIIPLAIIVSFLAWLSYLWTVESYRPSLKQTQALTKVADQVHAFMKQNNLRAMGIKSGAVLPEPLRGDPFIKTLPTDITRANRKIERVSFSYRCQPECYFTAYFFIDMPSTGTIGPYRYFQYNPNGYQEHMPEYPAQSRLTEHKQYNWFGWTDEFVPSIAEALKEDVGYVYFFCEPLEQEHWHFCRGEYD